MGTERRRAMKHRSAPGCPCREFPAHPLPGASTARPEGVGSAREHEGGMRRYLAVHRLPENAASGDWKGELTRLVERGHDVGIRAVETFYSAERGVAYTLFEAPDAASVANLHRSAALPAPDDVLPAERVFTELLAEPRRDR